MSDRHYSDDELVARLFGLGIEDSHLDSCELCFQRWNQFRQRDHLRRVSEIEVPEELLAAQRRVVYARVEQNPRKLSATWVPLPVGALLLVLLMFIVFKPTPQKQTPDVISGDEELQDVFTVGSRIDPVGLKPVQSLFEVQK